MLFNLEIQSQYTNCMQSAITMGGLVGDITQPMPKIDKNGTSSMIVQCISSVKSLLKDQEHICSFIEENNRCSLNESSILYNSLINYKFFNILPINIKTLLL